VAAPDIISVPIVEDYGIAVPPAPTPWAMICLIGAGALLVVLVGRLLYKLWQAKYDRVTLAKRPQRQALAQLKKAFAKWQKAGYMAFTYRVTEICKRYLAGRFDMRAPCRTTVEIRAAVEDLEQMSPAGRSKLLDLLQSCDLIKFAAAQTAADGVQGVYDAARAFIKETAWRSGDAC
jgi:hypothetical protein